MNIEPLIKSYLKYTNHYLADCEIINIIEGDHNDEGDAIYLINVKNDCLSIGYETIWVSVTELLSYMWEVLHNVTGVTAS